MTDDPTDEELVCARKTRFNTAGDADKEIERQKKDYGLGYRAYVCPVCSGWHLTKED